VLNIPVDCLVRPVSYFRMIRISGNKHKIELNKFIVYACSTQTLVALLFLVNSLSFYQLSWVMVNTIIHNGIISIQVSVARDIGVQNVYLI